MGWDSNQKLRAGIVCVAYAKGLLRRCLFNVDTDLCTAGQVGGRSTETEAKESRLTRLIAGRALRCLGPIGLVLTGPGIYRKEAITKARKFSFHTSCLATLILLTGCGGDPQETANPLPTIGTETERPSPVEGRWYRKNQLTRGEQLYQVHCAECHQPDTSGTKNWRELDAQGRYPPPPLNGTAHTWHHALPVLRRTVKRGGIPLGGWMPGFADKLNDQEIDDIFAWIQSHWSDEIYAIWQQRNTAATQSRQPNKMAESQRSTAR